MKTWIIPNFRRISRKMLGPCPFGPGPILRLIGRDTKLMLLMREAAH
ncbi:MAG: hypothetical protein H6566_20345 [Lewinellaceae bacterium]|nr:hypothetical protein [Lewinellaceae bacterium]